MANEPKNEIKIEEKEAMVNGGGLSARTYLIIALAAVVIAAVVWLILKKRK